MSRNRLATSHENNVATAFDILLEEIENTIGGLNQEGAEAFTRPDYDQGRDLMDKGSQMTAFRDKVYDLQKEWGGIFAIAGTHGQRQKGIKKTRRKLSRGLRTREAVFRIPILRTLVDLGGSGTVSDVLDRVGALLKSDLNQYDHSPLPSTGAPRWENSAQWTRWAMVREGLLAPDSPRGTWAITPNGKQWLASQGKTK